MQWTIRRVAVVNHGDSSDKTYRGIYTDGGTESIVVPAIVECLGQLGIQAKDVRVGNIPFYYLATLPPAIAYDYDEEFVRLLEQRAVRGEYCSAQQAEGLRLKNVLAKIESVAQINRGYRVEIIPTTLRPIGLNVSGLNSCKNVALNSGEVTVEVEAGTEADLVAHLRLAGNMMGLRWDPRSQVNQDFFGQPLI